MSSLPTRYLSEFIQIDLKKKMVFLGGPRQVGKTTLAQSLLKNFHDGHPAYLNWDFAADRRIIKTAAWPSTEPLIILDEIHKGVGWRNLIKGIYDKQKNSHQFLITGSARLDQLRKGGDSLLGRYHYYRLHPFSLPELGESSSTLDALFRFGGFPEPLLEKNEVALRRWHIQRVSRLVKTDLRDLEQVRDLDKVESLADELPNRVGSPLSIQSLAEDLNVNFNTARNWTQILESLYYCFRIAPFGTPKIRAVKKEQKLYLWDWSQITEAGPRFENMVGSHLLKYCHYQTDVWGEKMELRYIRDHQSRECDFVVLKNGRPQFAIEAKFSDKALSPHLAYFSERMNIPTFFQVSLDGANRTISDRLIQLNFSSFCTRLKLV